jgi:ADP-ribosyl-[dinitrogen reductase] hydrolase
LIQNSPSATLDDVVKGVALGDALGSRLEFLRAPSANDFRRQLDLPLIVSDDSQMMLFSLEAMKSGKSFEDAYLRWFSTQGPVKSGDGLLRFPEMYDVQAPGMTCMASCKALYLGRPVVNDSKGNGTVMRCAHIPYVARPTGASLDQVIALAKRDAETTHKHRFAAMSSMLLVALHWNLMDGLPVVAAVSSAIGAVDVDSEISRLCRSALDPDSYPEMRIRLGGWVAEEALALAIGAVAHNDAFLKVIQSAVTISGDSDTVGAIAGGLAAGAGIDVPAEFAEKLNVIRSIEYVLSL